jgi:hypothetical protein
LGIQQKHAILQGLEQGILMMATKPKAERDIRDSRAWFDGVEAMVVDLDELSRSIAGEARLESPRWRSAGWRSAPMNAERWLSVAWP